MLLIISLFINQEVHGGSSTSNREQVCIHNSNGDLNCNNEKRKEESTKKKVVCIRNKEGDLNGCDEDDAMKVFESWSDDVINAAEKVNVEW